MMFILNILVFLTVIFSVCIKILWLDKNLFSVNSEHLVNNIFFWGMLVIFIISVFNRIIRDRQILFELNSTNIELEKLKSENIDDIFDGLDEELSNEKKYKLLSNNWKAFKNSLLIVDNKLLQPVDSEEFYNNENLLHERINMKLLNYIPQLLVGLGMLGTFLGLSIGLAGLDLKSDDLKQIITLIAGTKTAFYTSLYGMYFSISMTIILNFYFGYYERRILKLKNILNILFTKYNQDRVFEKIKNEVIQIQKNTDELSKNVGIELVKGVEDYNKTTKEHLANLTALVKTNITGLAENVSQAFEEKLEKIFSDEFIIPFVSLKDKLLEISEINNEEISKYSKNLKEIANNSNDIKEAFNNISQETFKNFTFILNRIEDKYKEIYEVNEVSKEIYTQFHKLLNDSRDIIVSSNTYVEELSSVANIFKAITDKESTLLEFWNSNKNIVLDIKDTLNYISTEELKNIEQCSELVLDKLENYHQKFIENKNVQEEKMENYYRKHLEELFNEYDNSMSRAITLFGSTLGELQVKLNKIEENLKYSNLAVDKQIELVEKKYIESENTYKKEMENTSIEYKNMMKVLEKLTENINKNIVQTNELLEKNNQKLEKPKEPVKENNSKNIEKKDIKREEKMKKHSFS